MWVGRRTGLLRTPSELGRCSAPRSLHSRALRPPWRDDFCRDGFCSLLHRRCHPSPVRSDFVWSRCQLLTIGGRPRRRRVRVVVGFCPQLRRRCHPPPVRSDFVWSRCQLLTIGGRPDVADSASLSGSPTALCATGRCGRMRQGPSASSGQVPAEWPGTPAAAASSSWGRKIFRLYELWWLRGLAGNPGAALD
jgi:hypothetical protein